MAFRIPLLSKLFAPRLPPPLARIEQLSRSHSAKDAKGLELALAFEATSTRDERAQLARDALAALQGARAEERLELARSVTLPRGAAVLRDEAEPLLRYFIDDDSLRPFLGDEAVTTWLELDRPACVAYTLPRAELWRLSVVTE